MSALYVMRFLGSSGVGSGVLYVGKGIVLGIDEGGARYSGTYTGKDGRFRGQATLSAPAGATLVTGQQANQAMVIPLSVDWPANFADGNAQSIGVDGKPVNVTFEKLGDTP